MLCCRRRGQSSHEIVWRIRSVSEHPGEPGGGGVGGGAAGWPGSGWIRALLSSEVQSRELILTLRKVNQMKSCVLLASGRAGARGLETDGGSGLTATFCIKTDAEVEQ